MSRTDIVTVQATFAGTAITIVNMTTTTTNLPSSGYVPGFAPQVLGWLGCLVPSGVSTPLLMIIVALFLIGVWVLYYTSKSLYSFGRDIRTERRAGRVPGRP